jgi:methyl-accepting chemotaxis protein
MTIDERLEALTQTVELIAHAQIKTDERMAQLTERMGQLVETMNRLANVVIAHEERIERLEDSQ